MRLFNTLTQAREPFSAEGPVGLYVCGVTPYDTTHLGHARTYLVFDVLVRQLRASGLEVRYIQNVTDVDESILQRAAEAGEPYDRLGGRYTRLYLEDMATLGVLPADRYPTASEAVPAMQGIIKGLLDSGHAYLAGNRVFFRLGSFPGYGKLSRFSREEMLEAAARQDDVVPDHPNKEDPLDFLLWRAAGPGEPAWPSPWGEGRPGWHIECATLALTHLGPQLDIHGGGDDLVFPHHESEIAEAESATGVTPFARFWVHAGMVGLGGRKMAKSEGNVLFVRDVLQRHSADALRLYLLGTHYRRPVDFDEAGLEEAGSTARLLAGAARLPAREGGEQEVPEQEARRRFEAAMEDDLDTPAAIEALAGLARSIREADGVAAGRAQRTLLELAPRLGLRL
jgi:L-cysteine:1D-myo-inositol 2-amino-2-deoxy-alpha-D-glucopyranoside ligase